MTLIKEYEHDKQEEGVEISVLEQLPEAVLLEEQIEEYPLLEEQIEKYESDEDEDHFETDISIEQIKRKAHARKLRTTQAIASRLQEAHDGSRSFIRFSRAQCREHQLLIATFTTLVITGLLQRYSQLFVVGVVVDIFGGMDTIQAFHHLAAIVFILQSVYHVWLLLVLWFIKRELGSMWPRLKDISDLIQMVMFNLGLAKKRPEFDRFSVEEKLEYLALLWGTPLMIITGFVMWFPIAVTRVLPGDAIPVSRALHAWEAILATLAILTWHTYHVVIKEQNNSIFTGTMSEKDMRHEHPLEYRRILAAHKYLQKVDAKKKTPQNISPDSEVMIKETDHETV